MKHLDLFSGIGGFALACQWNGIETIGFVEIDKYCQKVLKKHWPDVPIVEDIRDVEGIKAIANATKFSNSELRNNGNCESYQESKRQSGGDSLRVGVLPRETKGTESPAILITAGFPCQPFSVAGKRQGEADDRYLWPETLTVIKGIKPDWILLENVTGIINLALGQVLSDLEGAGYTYETLIIPACAVNAWHRRDRVWIVANNNSVRNKWRPDEFGCRTSLQHEVGAGCPNVTNPSTQRLAQRTKQELLEQCEAIKRSSFTTNSRSSEPGRLSNKQRQEDTEIGLSDWWAVEPELGRVAHGIPNRVDRLKYLGNAIVPQVAYEIIKVIKENKGVWHD